MKFLFIHYKYINEIPNTVSNYLKHCEAFNDVSIPLKKHNQFIRECNRKIKKKTNDILKQYGYFEFGTYKLGDQFIKGWLVWLKLIHPDLFKNILYDSPVDIQKILLDKKEYWNAIIDFKYSAIESAKEDHWSALETLKQVQYMDILFEPIKDRLKDIFE